MNLQHLTMQIRVEQLVFWRNRSSVFFTFVLPVALVPVLALTGDPASHVPLVATLVILSNAFQGLAIQLAMHRDQGVLKTLMATPLAPGTFLWAKLSSIVLVILLELALVILLGALAFGAPIPAQPLLLLTSALVGSLALAALGCAVAGMIRTSESAPAVTNAAYLGLVLVTLLVQQVEGLPDAVRAAGELLPLAPLQQAIEHAWAGTWTASAWGSLGVVALWGVAAAIWALRSFRWEPFEER